MHRQNIPLRFVLGLIALGVIVAVSVTLMLSENDAVRVAGIVIGSVILAWWLVAPLLDARSSERHVERYPELLRNNPVGERVVAAGPFRPAGQYATGAVILNGEKWKAHCRNGHLPAGGEVLRVHGREGLTLLVRPTGNDGS